MTIILLVILLALSLGLFYGIHKYFEKDGFYLLAIIYSVISFILSFKLINIAGTDINGNIIFSSGLLMIVYYFVNRYSEAEVKKLMQIIMVSTLATGLYLVTSSYIIPSLNSDSSLIYDGLVRNNTAVIILYPFLLILSLYLGKYCFYEVKKINEKRKLKTFLILMGITFIDVFTFVYFVYAFTIRYDIAMSITFSTYLVKVLILFIYIYCIFKLFKVKKVKL